MTTLTIYIDEAGDPGSRDGLKYLGERHEWFTFGAVAVRSSREQEVVDWIGEMRDTVRSRQSGALHYHQVTKERRKGLCETLATKPCRAFVFASHKSNLRQYFNPRLGTMLSGERVYNWCFRLLLERVTAWAESWQKHEDGRISALSVVIATRGHDYDHFCAYIDKLSWQRQNKQLFLKGPGLSAEHLDRSSWRLEPCAEVAGLQLADVVASAFYQAANNSSPSHDIRPALALKPIMIGQESAANTGVTLWPLPHQGSIPAEARPIFEAYGYGFGK